MRVTVVGGGLAGLTAGHLLRAAGHDVTVLEGSGQAGGKVRSGQVGPVRVDLGAESILARRPEALELIDELGLADRVVHPAATTPAIWTKGELRPLPPTVQGIPSDLAALAAGGVIDQPLVSHPAPAPDHDVSVARFVTERVGSDVVERLVEPLLGGVYAGHADRLSLRAAAPQIAALAPDLLVGARQAAGAATQAGPVFAGLTGGVSTVAEELAERLGDDLVLDAPVRVVDRLDDGVWQVSHGPVGAISTVHSDAVLVAAPAPAAARLLATVAPEAAFELAGIEYASVVIVTFVLPPGVDLPGSGFLVPPIDGHQIKAATFSSNKWAWLAESGHTVLRASLGRAGESTTLQHDDDDLADLAWAELLEAVGSLPEPVARHVQRWGGALPQYEVGHLDRVAVIEQSIGAVPGLEVCGAAYRGIGIPAVIASAREAVNRLIGGAGQ